MLLVQDTLYSLLDILNWVYIQAVRRLINHLNSIFLKEGLYSPRYMDFRIILLEKGTWLIDR